MSNSYYSAICEVCSSKFKSQPAHANRFCSKTCQYIATQRPKIQCKQCGILFKTSWGKKNIFCSRECHNIYRRDNPRISPLKEGIDPICNICKKQFKKRGGCKQSNRFCSRECYLISHSNQTKISRICRYCGKEFLIHPCQALKEWPIYCSNACRKIGRKAKPRKCVACNTYFTPIQIRYGNSRFYVCTMNNRRVCSKKCLTEFYRNDKSRKQKISIAFTGSKHPLWRGGNENWRGPNWSAIREKVRKRAKYCCEKCGIHQEELKRKLDVNHKIPWRNFTDARLANRLSNLEALCQMCHHSVEPRKNVQMIFGFMARNR